MSAIKVKAAIKSIVPRSQIPLALKGLDLLRYARSWFYQGDTLVCPICNGHFRKFLPAGVKNQPNTRCPRCGSVARYRLFWLYLQNRTNLLTTNERLRVLHIAPERIFQGRLSALPIEYITADLEAVWAMLRMDITEIQFKDNTFDVIICNHTLEHVSDDRKAMRELLRVLKPNGWAILQSPVNEKREATFEDPSVVSPEERERLFGQRDHVRVYGRDYRDRLAEAGFSVKVEPYPQQLGPELLKRYRIDDYEKVYVCFKDQSVEQAAVSEGQAVTY